MWLCSSSTSPASLSYPPPPHSSLLLCSTYRRTTSCVNHTLMLLSCSFPRRFTILPFPWLAVYLRAAFCSLAVMGLKGRNANQPNLYQRQWKKNVSGDSISEDGACRPVCVSQKLQMNILFCVPRSPNTDTQHKDNTKLIVSVLRTHKMSLVCIWVCVWTQWTL